MRKRVSKRVPAEFNTHLSAGLIWFWMSSTSPPLAMMMCDRLIFVCSLDAPNALIASFFSSVRREYGRSYFVCQFFCDLGLS